MKTLPNHSLILLSMIIITLILPDPAFAQPGSQAEIKFGNQVFTMDVKVCDLGPAPRKGWVFAAFDPKTSYKAAVRNRLKDNGSRYQMVRVTRATGASSLVNWVANRYQQPGGQWTESYKPDSPAADGPLFEITANGIQIDHDLKDRNTGEIRHANFTVNCLGGGPPDTSEAPGSTVGGEYREFWKASVDGRHQGTIAIADVQNGRLVNVMLYSAPGVSQLIAIYINHPVKNGTFAVGSGAQAETEVVFLKGSDLYSGIRKGFMSGQPDDGYTPEPPVLNISEITTTNVTGSVSGVLWRSQPAPGDPNETTNASIEFTARACHQQSPDHSRCMDPQKPWP